MARDLDKFFWIMLLVVALKIDSLTVLQTPLEIMTVNTQRMLELGVHVKRVCHCINFFLIDTRLTILLKLFSLQHVLREM